MPRTVTNATAIYMIMMLVFAAGMWVILALGSTLRAPPDLAGEWLLAPEGDPRQETMQAVLEQSGKFVRFRVGKDALDMTVREHDSVPGDRRIELEGGQNSAIFEKTPAVDVYRLTLRRLSDEDKFTARIVARAYPRTTGAQQQARAKSRQQTTQPAYIP